MKDPVEGRATLVNYELTNTGNEFDAVIQAQLVVEADGLQPTAVEAFHGVPHGDLPLPQGTVWMVRVDRKNPKHLKFLDSGDAADAHVEAGRAEAARGGGDARTLESRTLTKAEIEVRVQPRASRNEIAGERDVAVVVRVTAPPVGGAANEGVRKTLAKRLGVANGRVEIVRGDRGRDKLVRVEGMTSAELKRRLIV